jgi:hypothetical protein
MAGRLLMLAILWADTTLHDMFWMAVPVIEKIFRATIVYLALMLGIRLAGKRELAQLNPFDLIVLLTLSNTVQNAIIGDDNSVTGGLLGAATLFILNYLVVRISYRSPRLQKLFGGEPDVLIRHGHIIHHNLEREMITREELLAAAHRQGLSSLRKSTSAFWSRRGHCRSPSASRRMTTRGIRSWSSGWIMWPVNWRR